MTEVRRRYFRWSSTKWYKDITTRYAALSDSPGARNDYSPDRVRIMTEIEGLLAQQSIAQPSQLSNGAPGTSCDESPPGLPSSKNTKARTQLEKLRVEARPSGAIDDNIAVPHTAQPEARVDTITPVPPATSNSMSSRTSKKRKTTARPGLIRTLPSKKARHEASHTTQSTICNDKRTPSIQTSEDGAVENTTDRTDIERHADQLNSQVLMDDSVQAGQNSQSSEHTLTLPATENNYRHAQQSTRRDCLGNTSDHLRPVNTRLSVVSLSDAIKYRDTWMPGRSERIVWWHETVDQMVRQEMLFRTRGIFHDSPPIQCLACQKKDNAVVCMAVTKPGCERCQEDEETCVGAVHPDREPQDTQTLVNPVDTFQVSLAKLMTERKENRTSESQDVFEPGPSTQPARTALPSSPRDVRSSATISSNDKRAQRLDADKELDFWEDLYNRQIAVAGQAMEMAKLILHLMKTERDRQKARRMW
ncbi:hypothetical protein EIP86_006688 [Pleurotus ostreatoroseus]|nr:hypothetical protein EIP86_006688 [Pleurotus ostreatoroseus]